MLVNIKINYGAFLDPSKTFSAVYTFSPLAMALFWCTFCTQLILDESYDVLMKLSTSNVTASWFRLFCDLPYEECLCSVQSTKNISLEDCVTDRFLLGSRICPLVSIILQFCLIRDVFSITGKYSRFLVKTLWIGAVFIFIFIANGINRSSCLHRGTSYFVHAAGGTLLLLIVFDLLDVRDTDYPSSINQNAFNRLDVIDEETSDVESMHDELLEDTNNQRNLWKKLL